jgi:hypothetical protein
MDLDYVEWTVFPEQQQPDGIIRVITAEFENDQTIRDLRVYSDVRDGNLDFINGKGRRNQAISSPTGFWASPIDLLTHTLSSDGKHRVSAIAFRTIAAGDIQEEESRIVTLGDPTIIPKNPTVPLVGRPEALTGLRLRGPRDVSMMDAKAPNGISSVQAILKEKKLNQSVFKTTTQQDRQKQQHAVNAMQAVQAVPDPNLCQKSRLTFTIVLFLGVVLLLIYVLRRNKQIYVASVLRSPKI